MAPLFCRFATALACFAVLLVARAQPARAQSEERAPQAEINALASLPYSFLERFRQGEFNSLYVIAYDAVNPFYLTGDFDGDGEMDYALKLRAKTNKDVAEDAVFFAKGEPRLISNDIKEDYPGPAWYVVSETEKQQMRSAAVEEGGKKSAKLKGDAIMMVRPESSTALVFWNGKRFELSWLGGD